MEIEDKVHLFVLTISILDWISWSETKKKLVLTTALGWLGERTKLFLSEDKNWLVYYAIYKDSEVNKNKNTKNIDNDNENKES